MLKIEGKKTKQGFVLLRFAYSNRGRKYIPTGVTIPSDHFNPRSLDKPVRSANPNATYLNQQVRSVYDRIEAICSDLKRRESAPIADEVVAVYRSSLKVAGAKVANTSSFDSVFETMMATKAYNGSTRKLYETLAKHFRRSFGNADLTQFGLPEWNQFRVHLSENGCKSTNTVCIRLKKLKCLLKFAQKQGITVPIKTFDIPKEEVKKIALDLRSLEKIKACKPTSDALQRVKDLCLFQCHTALRISDLKRLNRSHIVEYGGGYFIDMNSYKTNVPMYIPLGEVALEILQRNDFQLPIIAEPYYNRMLKKLLKEAGIDQVVEWIVAEKGEKIVKQVALSDAFTNHCCSRTAIPYFFSEGYSPDQVAGIVGKSIPTIMKYYIKAAAKSTIREKHLERQKLGG